jgi:hypothetical protein
MHSWKEDKSMSEDGHLTHPSDDDRIDYAGVDGIPALLSALQKLAQRSRHPMVQVCLEQAYDDIVHLTSYGDARRDDDDDSSAEDGRRAS